MIREQRGYDTIYNRQTVYSRFIHVYESTSLAGMTTTTPLSDESRLRAKRAARRRGERSANGGARQTAASGDAFGPVRRRSAGGSSQFGFVSRCRCARGASAVIHTFSGTDAERFEVIDGSQHGCGRVVNGRNAACVDRPL